MSPISASRSRRSSPCSGDPPQIVRHPEADLALLRLAELEDDVGAHAFRDAVPNPHVEEFIAYGYPPMGMLGDEPIEPRLFRGHLRRFFSFRPEDGSYRYAAGELNIPAPAGLSGGPLFRSRAPDMLIAMVTASLNTSVAAGEETFEEKLPDDSYRKTVYRHVINYGIALIVDDVRDWLDEHVPPAPAGG